MRNDGWSIVLPIKDEIEMLSVSLPSAIRLNPDEILIVVDEGASVIGDVARSIARTVGYRGLRVLEVSRIHKWRFHQVYARREGYRNASYDTIFTFDVDTILTKNVMQGYRLVGKDNVAVVTFRKFLATNSPVKFFRCFLYEIRRRLARVRWRLSLNPPKPLIGIYWLYRPYYMELAPEEEISQIFNGEDVFIQFKLNNQNRYRSVFLDVIGCTSLREGNEDESWRQLQLGMWMKASGKSFLVALIHSLSKGYPYLMRGYIAGKSLPKDVSEGMARLSYPEFIMYSNFSSPS